MPEQSDDEKTQRLDEVRDRLRAEAQERAKGNGADPEPAAGEEDPLDEAAIRSAVRALRVDIGQLGAESPPDWISKLVERIVLEVPDEVEQRRLFETIKQQTRTPVGTLQKQANAVRRRRRQERRKPTNGMVTDREGRPLALEHNAIVLTRTHTDVKGLFGLDEFRQRSVLLRRPPWAKRGDDKFPRPARDADLGEYLAWLQCHGVHLRNKTAVRTALSVVVQDNVFHPIRDYLDGLKWDGVPRLDFWLTTYLGVVPIENYTGPAGQMWMISAVARIYRPGCIVKYVLIIEGPQDLGKSTALRILGGEWCSDDIATLGSKDSQMQVGNAWIIELAELDSTRRADINSIKAFISRAVDRFRPPYGEHVIEQERQCVLAASVNPAGAYLHDETGAVRFWPVAATKINLAELERDRNQLWAEAVHRYKAEEPWWPIEGDGFAPQEEQEKRSETVEDDPWFPEIARWLAFQEDFRLQSGAEEGFAMADILTGAIRMSPERMDKRAERRAGAIMRKLGFVSVTVRLKGLEKPVRRWMKVASP
jgi:predicted P-loop ATPase